MPAGGVGACGRGHRGLRERVEGENLRTRAPPGSGAGGGDGGRGPQNGHGGEGAARVTHCALSWAEGRMRASVRAEQILCSPELGGSFSTPPTTRSGGPEQAGNSED